MTWLRILGKFLISVGVGVLLFVAWVLWGTGIYTAQQQDRLEEELAQLPDIKPEVHGSKKSEAPKFFGPGDDFEPGAGDPVFSLSIPEIKLSDVVVQGVGEEELKLGPGHYPDCSPGFAKPLCTDAEEVWPGEKGRVIVSGHRTTHGAPFWDLDKLKKGDEILTGTQWGEFTYEVTGIEVVSPNARDIANPTPGGSKGEIVLTTCNPKFSAAERLIVFAEMKEAA
ncbi:MAG: sortase [Actinomycetota bacterium]|nr:sortase [Actinomycetota bacterium]